MVAAAPFRIYSLNRILASGKANNSAVTQFKAFLRTETRPRSKPVPQPKKVWMYSKTIGYDLGETVDPYRKVSDLPIMIISVLCLILYVWFEIGLLLTLEVFFAVQICRPSTVTFQSTTRNSTLCPVKRRNKQIRRALHVMFLKKLFSIKEEPDSKLKSDANQVVNSLGDRLALATLDDPESVDGKIYLTHIKEVIQSVSKEMPCSNHVFLTLRELIPFVSQTQANLLKSTVPRNVTLHRLNPKSTPLKIGISPTATNDDPSKPNAKTKSNVKGNVTKDNSGYYRMFVDKKVSKKETAVPGYQKPLDKTKITYSKTRPQTSLNPYYKLPLASEKQTKNYNIEQFRRRFLFSDEENRTSTLKPYFIPKSTRYNMANNKRNKQYSAIATTRTQNPVAMTTRITKNGDTLVMRQRPRSTRKERLNNNNDDVLALNVTRDDPIHEEANGAKLTKADIDFNRFFEGKASSAPPMSTGYYNRLFGKRQ